jgi:chemotaxis protein MotA
MLKGSAFGGILLAVAGIAIGLYLDGGGLGQLLQPTAALIVIGGTLGAVLIQFPASVTFQAAKQLKLIFWSPHDLSIELIADLSRYAVQARRNGLMSIDADLDRIDDPFLRRCFTLAVDGATSIELRQTMNIVLEAEATNEAMLAKVFDAAGGFAPTIGILGAVIGLIQVMQRMENISEVGRGIAVAFVATIYGVGAANIFFLPCAGRVRILAVRRRILCEMMLDGVACIVDGLNPRAIEQKLSGYVTTPSRHAEYSLVAR